MDHLGEFAALLTAVFWTITVLSFESAGKRVGSLAVNFIRLVMAFFLLGLYGWITRGLFFPFDAGEHAWLWLSLSGLIGFSLGDLLLFRAFVEIGSRVSMLIMSLVPPLTALMSWMIIGEVMPVQRLLAMTVTVIGIAMVILVRHPGNKRKLVLNHPLRGLLLAFGGSLGQAMGLVLSKYAIGSYDPFAATHIRIMAGIVGFAVLFTLIKRWGHITPALRDKAAMKRISLGAFFGPFLGVSFSLLAVQYTETGTASTLMAITPVLIIAPAAILFKERIRLIEIIGAIVAVAGVSLFFV